MEVLEFLSSIQFFGILFAFAVLVYLAYVFVILYHLIRFGIGAEPKSAALGFFLGAIVLLIVAFLAFLRADPSAILIAFPK